MRQKYIDKPATSCVQSCWLSQSSQTTKMSFLCFPAFNKKQGQRGGLTLTPPPPVFPQHDNSHYSTTEPGGNPSLNGGALAKKDSIILKAVNTISTDRSSPSPDPPHTHNSPAQVTGYTYSPVI